MVHSTIRMHIYGILSLLHGRLVAGAHRQPVAMVVKEATVKGPKGDGSLYKRNVQLQRETTYPKPMDGRQLVGASDERWWS
jgi:hypothetical protein